VALSTGRGGTEADLRFVDDAAGLSGIRDVEDGSEPFGRPVPFVVALVRDVFAAEPGSSFSAFRFGADAGLEGRGAGVAGFSPVMEASRSPI
jgi:hypothetical protein